MDLYEKKRKKSKNRKIWTGMYVPILSYESFVGSPLGGAAQRYERDLCPPPGPGPGLFL